MRFAMRPNAKVLCEWVLRAFLIKEEIHTGQTHWYHRNELMWMLELAGFQDVDVKGDWTDETLNSEHEKEMIFVATKNGDK